MKKTFTIAPDFAVEYGIISGPVHHDGCDHESGYVCSFESYCDLNKTRDTYDLYVFDQWSGQSVCLRFGSEPGEYMSPGPVGQFLRATGSGHNRVYITAARILEALGSFRWDANEGGAA